jgi:hypothetical protein
MTYDDKYQKTEARMLEVIETVQDLTKDRFIASLYVRNCTPVDIDIRLAEVRRCLDTVYGEMLRLSKFRMSFNLDFAVDDNQRFTTAEMLFNRLRSSMACIRKRLRQGCPIIRKLPPNPNFKPSVFERSVLTKGCCARDLYDITSFDDNVQALYYEQQALFACVIASLSICYSVIKEEKDTIADPALCVQRLDEQCERLLEEMEDRLDFMNNIPESEILKKIEVMGKEKYAQSNFHKPSVREMKIYAANIGRLRQQQQTNGSIMPSKLLQNGRADDVILLITHFDDIRPSNRKKMDALKIRLFCNYCDGGKVDNPKQIYYQLLLNLYKGKHECFPERHAITTSNNKKGLDIMAEQKKFNEECDALLKKLRQSDMQKVS